MSQLLLNLLLWGVERVHSSILVDVARVLNENSIVYVFRVVHFEGLQNINGIGGSKRGA